MDNAEGASAERALAGYSLGNVVADLSRAACSPLTLALEQVLGYRLLDARCVGGHA